MSQSETNPSLLYSVLSSEVLIKVSACLNGQHSMSSADSLLVELGPWLYTTETSLVWEACSSAQEICHSNHVASFLFIAFTDQQNKLSYFKPKLFKT